jgi:hypothetical protein
MDVALGARETMRDAAGREAFMVSGKRIAEAMASLRSTGLD